MLFVIGLVLVSVAYLGSCARRREVVRETLPDPRLIPIAYSENYNIRVKGAEKFTSFDLAKYSKVHRQLIKDALRTRDEFLVPRKISEEDLLLVHSRDYLESLKDPEEVAKALEAGLVAILPPVTLRKRIVDPFLYATGGTLLAARRALERGLAVNLAGGYQHASSDHGEGFCLIADVPIAIRVLMKEGKIKKAMIVDCDNHQGQGSAHIFSGDDSVFIIDFFERANYPQVPSEADLPVPLDSGIGDEAYMEALKRNLPGPIEDFRPDVIFYVAGSDVYRGDQLGGLGLSEEGILERDRYVIRQARSRNIPLVMVLSGGYSEASWQIHYRTVRWMIEEYKR